MSAHRTHLSRSFHHVNNFWWTTPWKRLDAMQEMDALLCQRLRQANGATNNNVLSITNARNWPRVIYWFGSRSKFNKMKGKRNKKKKTVELKYNFGIEFCFEHSKFGPMHDREKTDRVEIIDDVKLSLNWNLMKTYYSCALICRVQNINVAAIFVCERDIFITNGIWFRVLIWICWLCVYYVISLYCHVVVVVFGCNTQINLT